MTINPSLYVRMGGKLEEGGGAKKKGICEIVRPECAVSAESVAMTRDEIVADGLKLAAIAPNVVVKIPTMVEGLAATHTLAQQGVPVNMTLCFTVPQALLAVRAGARYISPFVGRFDFIGRGRPRSAGQRRGGHRQLRLHRPSLLTARRWRSSPRPAAPSHVTQAALMGADMNPPQLRK